MAQCWVTLQGHKQAAAQGALGYAQVFTCARNGCIIVCLSGYGESLVRRTLAVTASVQGAQLLYLKPGQFSSVEGSFWPRPLQVCFDAQSSRNHASFTMGAGSSGL